MTSKRTRNTLVFFIGALVWLVLDQLTKALADTAAPGTVLWPGAPGVFDFLLVHNTGGAWGLFAGSQVALGVFALVVCLVILIAAHLRRSKGSAGEMLALALVLAGGLGNAIDRFVRDYVVDFFDFCLIDYPVFNVADIGVVMGIILLVIVLFRETGNERTSSTRDASSHPDDKQS